MAARTILTSLIILSVAGASSLGAQARVQRDSSWRFQRFVHDAGYGVVEGLAYSGLDQLNDAPAEWGSGWPGYGRRAASNVGEFLVQESVTEGLAGLMHRPLDYRRCRCSATGARIGSALRGAITDQRPNGSHPLAIPRIVGAYAGSFAQATWRPTANRTQTALLNGTSSLALGVLINLYHEFRR